MWSSFWALLLLLAPAAFAKVETICGSLELHQISDFDRLRNCSIILGHVRIANVELPPNADVSELRSEVTEISDYLLIYRTNGLLTLESIFPRLRLVRGHRLLFDQYALAVYQNRNLRELGLVELLRIQNGYIRIESNPMLCFVETVNWIYLLGNSTRQHYSIKYNRSPNHCPVCGGLAVDYSYRQKTSIFCWNLKSAQLQPTPPRLAPCPAHCDPHGCDLEGRCCQRTCLTGCSASNCELCGNFNSNGRCVNQCIGRYQLYERQCITQRECRQLGLIPVANECVDSCPAYQKPIRDVSGNLNCQVECKGRFHVKRLKDLSPLRDCVTINGSLIIELVDVKEKIVEALEQTFDGVKEITGFLKILRSAQLMSLSFLKNLDTIRGDELIENKYAFYVVDNHHLERIWAFNQQVAIQRGSIFFHLNPRLCYEQVMELEKSLKNAPKLSVSDVSPNSNGERIICGPSVRTLEVTIEDFNSTAVRLAVNYLSSEDMETLIGYSYHYMVAPFKNVTMYDGRHGCGHDNWHMDISASKVRRHVIRGLKPYTQYAFFVKTLTRTDYHMQIDAYSRIMYFRTMPSRPSPVTRLFGYSQASTQIMLHWWPPLRPNGEIVKYIISYEWYNKAAPETSTKNYENFRHPTNYSSCACDDLVPYNSGPQPEDEEFYNKEQITYEDALPNLIYVSRRRDTSKKEKFDRVKNYSHLTAPPPTLPPTTTPIPVLSANSASPLQATESNDTSTDKTMTEGEIFGAKQYELYRQKMEDKLRSVQDTGFEDFLIEKPTPACADNHASVSFQVEEKCVVAEELTGIELPGTQHYFRLTNLNPDQAYRITVRACVKDVIDGCSKPTEALIRTITLRIEDFVSKRS